MSQFDVLFDEFMRDLQEEGEIPNITSKFVGCEFPQDQIELVSNLNTFLNVFTRKDLTNHKSLEAAQECKNAGNTAYKKKDFQRALVLYTKGIFASQHPASPENILSLLYANRSAVLYNLQKFSECCRDIDLALQHGYPKVSTFKLYERKGKSQLCMGNLKEAEDAFNLAIQALGVSDREKKEKNTRAREICHQLQQCKSTAGQEVAYKNVNSLRFIEPAKLRLPSIPLDNRHPIYLSASDSFQLSFLEVRGRYGTASKDIEPGEIIMIDKPFAKVLLPDHHFTHCFHCLTRCYNLIPCSQCCNVGYCSEECENTAWRQYHSIDCCILNKVVLSKLGLGYLALRVVITAGFEHLMPFKNTINSTEIPSLKSGLSSNGVYDPLSFSTIFSLVGNTTKRTVADIFKRAVKATFMLNLLQSTGYFPTDVSQKNVYFIGGILLQQLQMLPCNAHEISELSYKGSFASAESSEIGSAIYATLSLLNHSCDPSVVRHCYGETCVLRSIKKIRKGEEIVDNYGTVYAVSPKVERQTLLQSQYYFECQCVACKKNWPLYDNIRHGDPTFKCNTCHEAGIFENDDSVYLTCATCQNKVNFSKKLEKFFKARENYIQAKNKVLNGDFAHDFCRIFLDYLNLMCDFVKLPWQEFNDCQEIIKQCFSLQANCQYLCESEF